MTKKLLLLIVLFIFLLSLLTVFLIFNYLDPYRNELVSLITLVTSVTLCVTSFFTIFLYIFKKVRYRGEVFLSHIFSSMRQGFLINLFILGVITFKIIGVLSFSTVLLLLVIMIFIELMFQNM